MKRLFAPVFVLACITFAVAEDYVTLIHKKDGSVVAVRVDETDSITFTSEQVPADWFSTSDTIIINDTVFKTLWVHDTIFFQIHDTISVEKPIWVHDTLYVERIVHDTIFITTPEEPEITYTINGVEYPMPEAVDLGLPSGTKWANMNIGATKSSEEGLRFACGETIVKDEFTEENYSIIINPGGVVKKEEDSFIKWARTEHDAAYVYTNHIFCLPSKEQYYELTDNCIFEESIIDENTVIVCTSKINGTQLILPVAFRLDGYNCYDGMCFISATHSHCAYYESGFKTYTDWETELYKGMCIRPVLVK